LQSADEALIEREVELALITDFIFVELTINIKAIQGVLTLSILRDYHVDEALLASAILSILDTIDIVSCGLASGRVLLDAL
jgi:hypothetical protein